MASVFATWILSRRRLSRPSLPHGYFCLVMRMLPSTKRAPRCSAGGAGALGTSLFAADLSFGQSKCAPQFRVKPLAFFQATRVITAMILAVFVPFSSAPDRIHAIQHQGERGTLPCSHNVLPNPLCVASEHDWRVSSLSRTSGFQDPPGALRDLARFDRDSQEPANTTEHPEEFANLDNE